MARLSSFSCFFLLCLLVAPSYAALLAGTAKLDGNFQKFIFENAKYQTRSFI